MRTDVLLAFGYIVSAPLCVAKAAPHLVVSAQHLGEGLVQYTLEVDNDLGGNVNAVISVSGQIHQIAAVFSDTVDFHSSAETAAQLDPAYQAAGGMAADSWWNDAEFGTLSPAVGNDLGGEVGSTLFQICAGTFGLGAEPNMLLLGQIVIQDERAAGLPIGPAKVSDHGLARMSVIDPDPQNPTMNSALSAAGQSFSIVGDFAVVPEPAGWILGAIAAAMVLGPFTRGRPRRLDRR